MATPFGDSTPQVYGASSYHAGARLHVSGDHP
eukprot:CAMPEP_0172888852 /NCGR_PEP_ID=MMETSP1075-20121228/137379_1 /TAXON_ID=2916 /ORGANISM="Ceratium fusus, Strain PA161109" /LENGTH=31 /DNA_ID= /DNA_START= /DNA_END= /DNA_ORIENTATION=